MPRLDDGHSTKISFSADSSVEFYEKEVTPPGIDGGGPNDVTTMRNLKWRSMSPKKLKTLTDMSATVAYDPLVLNPSTGSVFGLVNVNNEITVTFADGSTLKFWGWLNSFRPGSSREGDQPVAEIVVHPSNHDNASPPAEQDPVYGAPA